MKHLLICCYLLSLCKIAFAQLPYRYFNKITVQDGLSHSRINCITQDARGFTWIGTNDGLNRYDGKHFTVFRHQPNDTTSISGNIITDLLEDEQQLLWVATADGGLTRYDYRASPNNQFKQYKNIPGDSSSIPVNGINAIAQDEYGYLWLATSGKSVIRFDKKRQHFITPIHTGTRTALTLCRLPGHQLWAGRQGGGLLKINTSTLTFSADQRYNNLYAALPHAAISALFYAKDNKVWMGSWDKVLYTVNPATEKETVFKRSGIFSFNNDEALDFAEDAYQNIWIAGRHNGLHIYNKKTNEFYNYAHEAAKEGTVASNTINCLFIDKKGIVWLGTDRGISIHVPLQQSFKQTFIPSDKNNLTIYDFYKDGSNGLLIGSSEGLFIRRSDSDAFEHRPLKFDGVPLAVTKIKKFVTLENGDYTGSQFLLGTNVSLFSYDVRTKKLQKLPGTEKDIVMNTIIDSRVVSIVRDTIDGHEALIVSPYGHYLAYYDLVEKKWVSRTDTVKNIINRFNLKDNLIRKIYKSRKNKIWIATAKFGVGSWTRNPSVFVRYYENHPLKTNTVTNNNISDLLEDDLGNLWVSTYGGGLNYFNTGNGQFRHIPESNNLLEGLQTDRMGNVWMLSNGNLDKYNIVTKSFVNYVLPDLEKSGGVRGNMYKDTDGKLYMAGTNFFICFQPELVPEVNSRPDCYLIDFKIFNTSFRHLLLSKDLRLDYNQNFFTFEFSAPDYFNGNIQYAYKLEGYDRDWIDAGTRNTVSYSNVSDGQYVFKVKATNKKGSWTRKESTIAIQIIPPFWKTWWFYVISFLIVSSAIYALYRYRINELLQRQAIRNKIAQDLHDNVGSTLSSIGIYSQVAKIYSEQAKQTELKNALEKISTACGEMIGEMSDTVWAINPANDHLGTIIQKMESFARPLLAAKQIKIDFRYDQSILALNLGMTKRKNFYLIFKEAINNAVKYADCTAIQIAIECRQHRMTLYIKDNGKGFNLKGSKEIAKTTSGNGLINIKRRAAEIGGTCSIQSHRKEGTIIHLEFPIP